MNTKFNLGSFEVKIPAGEDNPEINVTLKDMSYEVTEMSLTEYGSVMKSIMVEGFNAVKDFARLQEEVKQADFDREQMRHEMRMQEINARAKADEERRKNLFNVSDSLKSDTKEEEERNYPVAPAGFPE